MTDVGIITSLPTSSHVIYLAQEQGYFTEQGLNVEIVNIRGSGSDLLAGLAGGAAQFASMSTSASTLGMAQGVPITAIMSQNYGVYQELIVRGDKAEEIGLELGRSTAENAASRFEALKGSGLKIGFSNAASSGYATFRTLAEQFGVTVGEGLDVEPVFLGSAQTIVTGFQTGQVDGIVGSPPATMQPDVAAIQFWLVPPASVTAYAALLTTNEMIEDHPDTVQAVVTAITQAWDFGIQNPAEATEVLTPMFEDNEITDPAVIAELAQYSTTTELAGQTPALTQEGFDAMIASVAATNTDIDFSALDFDAWADTTFVDRAIEDLGLDYPLSR